MANIDKLTVMSVRRQNKLGGMALAQYGNETNALPSNQSNAEGDNDQIPNQVSRPV